MGMVARFCPQGLCGGGLALSQALGRVRRLRGREEPTTRAEPSVPAGQHRPRVPVRGQSPSRTDLPQGVGPGTRDLGVKFASCSPISAPRFPHLKGGGPRPRLTLILWSIWATGAGGGAGAEAPGEPMGRARCPEPPSAWPLPGAWEGEADLGAPHTAGPSLGAPPSESACLAKRTRP